MAEHRPTFEDLTVEKDVMIPMRDGVRLRTHIYRPSVPGRYPVLLTRVPYDWFGAVVPVTGDPAAFFTRRGYVVVVQHCRGCYGSEGDLYPLHQEVEDGYDAVEWAASLASSNGKVAMFGESYLAITQWTAANARPPHLVAITPQSCPWDYFDGFPYAARGVLNLDLALSWASQASEAIARYRGVEHPIVSQYPAPSEVAEALVAGPGSEELAALQKRVGGILMPLFKHRPLRELPAFRSLAPWWAEWLDHPTPDDSYWRPVAPAAHAHAFGLPALHVAGWYDVLLRGMITAYQTLGARAATEGARRAQRLVIGPWDHVGMARDFSVGLGVAWDGKVGEVVLPENARAGTTLSEVARFLDHWVQVGETGLQDDAPIRLYVMGEDVWRDEWEWPLARTAWTSYFLHSNGRANTLSGDGVMSVDPPGGEPPDSYVYDPDDPVPSRGGPLALPWMSTPGPVDQCEIEARPDVLVYTSAPLSSNLEVTGPVALELWCSSSARDTDFTAKLVDVYPDGRALNVCEGIVRTRYAFAKELLLSPQAIYRFDVDLAATSNVFKAGHSIRLEVSSSNYPSYDLNPNTGAHAFDDVTGVTRKADQRIYHDAAHPSRLILPVIPT